jgi:3',5'-cyclic AMP phosphodiesterase CpdA
MADDDTGARQTISPAAQDKSELNIIDLITEGQEILVQVAKSPIGTKGARITSHISLPGRFLVLMPHSGHIGISRRIENEAERSRLKELVAELRQSQLGYIVRTAAEGVQAEKLAQEMAFLIKLWDGIREKYQKAPTPSLIHQELDIRLRAVRDLLLHEAETLIIDSRDGYQEILSFLDTFMPKLKSSVALYEGNEPIFDAYNLEGDISRALRKKVWLQIRRLHCHRTYGSPRRHRRKHGALRWQAQSGGDHSQDQPRSCQRDRLPDQTPRYRRDHHYRFHRYGEKVQSGEGFQCLVRGLRKGPQQDPYSAHVRYGLDSDDP